MMADTREGEDRVVFRREGKSHEIEEGPTPQIHLQGSSAQGGPSPGTSSNIHGDLPDALRPKREKRSASQHFALFAQATIARLAKILGRGPCRPRQDTISRKLRKRLDALKGGEEVSAAKRPCETGEGSSVTKSAPRDTSLTQGGDLVGLHGHKEQLIKLLLADNSGTTDVLVKGGSGMTALVRKVCEDVRTREQFDTIAWISAPQLNDSELTREEILLQLLFENAPFPDDFDADRQEVKYFANSSEHNKARCLIVIDNLVDRRTQKTLRKVSRLFKTYKVIFMARHDSPINEYGRECVNYELKDLSVAKPWAHFRSKKVCNLVLRMFGSLPGAIVLHLRNGKERNYEWASMILPSFNLIRQVLEILPNDDHLFCLLYLSIFPNNSEISRNRVSRLWVAEGFLPDLGEAEGVFNDLLDKKCIQPAEKRSDGELSTFRMGKLVREIFASLSRHCNLGRITSQDRTIRDLNEEKPFQLSSKFMLDFSSNEDTTTTSKASQLEPSKKDSKVLDLTGTSFQIIPDKVFELTDAKYLSLRNTSIKVIPGSIGKLRDLEFLDAKHSLVTKLPQQAARLKKIRHILIYHQEKDPLMESNNVIGFKASCRIGGFKRLEKLCFVESDNSVLEDLGNLTKLSRLGITKLKREHGVLLCSSLEKLEGLKSLNVHGFDEDEIIDLHGLSSPPKFLKHLYLHGRLEKLPNWISSHDGLTKVILRWSQLEEDLLVTLGELRNLLELELHRAYNGKQLNFKKGQFPKLEILLIDELEGLRTMSLEKETMLSLEQLTISRCQWLERMPSGIEHIPTIQKLTFFDMSHEFYDKVREDHEKDDYKKFKHIPEISFTRWRAGHWEPHQVESTDKAHQVMEKSSRYNYDVFLSFRGLNARMDIIDYLYTHMIDVGIRAYKDDEELHIGEEIGGQLLQAIEQSKISIPIFSKGYADSAWCLMELVKMVESKNTRRQKIMPIFYDVTPLEVREHYGNAIVCHANKKRFSDETIEKWKAALSEVGALKGWDLQCMPNRNKGEFVKEVVDTVLAELKTAYLEVPECLVEVDNHVDEIMRMIGAYNPETKIVGIYGIGGIGKTTLAKIVYNQLSNDFDDRCFLSNIQETEITHLQNQLISIILRRQWHDILDIMEGKKLIEQMLCSRKVLLLLDDVDNASQLEALMQKSEWFGKGSKIIITTRDRGILNVPTVDGTYELTRLDFDHSLQLFSKHAFRRDYPVEEQYIFHSKRAVTICGGLPIALEVLGSLLSGKIVEEWDTTLKELEEFPQEDVQRELMISIEALNEAVLFNKEVG